MARPEHGLRQGPALLLALLLCALISVWHGGRSGGRAARPISGFVRDAAIVPTAAVSGRIGHWFRVTVLACFAGPQLSRSNERLQSRVNQLLLENHALSREAQENARLRAMLGLEQKSALPLLAADVATIKPYAYADTLVIARGLGDGVGPHSVVLGPNGALVGQVVEASAHSSTVLLLTDSGSSVGAEVSPRPPATVSLAHRVVRAPAAVSSSIGICAGTRSPLLDFEYLNPDAAVRPGDLVVTSGLGGVFPHDLPVGKVLSVTIDAARSLKQAEVRPIVDFDHLEQVLVLPAGDQ